MSDAKRCDACHELYIPNTKEDLEDRPEFLLKRAGSFKKLIGITLYDHSNGNRGYKDLCPDCARIVAAIFSDVDIFSKEEPPSEKEKPTKPEETED